MNRPLSQTWASLICCGAMLLAATGCSEHSEVGRAGRDLTVQCGAEPRPLARDPKEIPFQLSETRTGDKPFQIVTTIGMVTDIVRQVAGDRAKSRG